MDSFCINLVPEGQKNLFIFLQITNTPWNGNSNKPNGYHQRNCKINRCGPVLGLESRVLLPSYGRFHEKRWYLWFHLQVNLFQKLLFLHQLTQNMTKDCSLIYQFLHENYKLRTCCVHKLFWMSKQKTNLCTQHVLSLLFSCTELVNGWTIFSHILG